MPISRSLVQTFASCHSLFDSSTDRNLLQEQVQVLHTVQDTLINFFVLFDTTYITVTFRRQKSKTY